MTVQKQSSPLIKNIDLNTSQRGGRNKEKPTLDEALDQLEGMEADELLQSKARAVRAEYDLRTRETENRLRHIEGGVTVDEGKKKEEEVKLAEQRDKITIQAKALIDSGMDAKQVGQMLMGLPTIGGTPAIPGQGMGFEEVMQLMTFVIGKKETDELKGGIAALTKQVEELSRGGGVRGNTQPIDPITFAKQQAEAVSAWYKAIREITPEPPSVSAKGESLEVVREQNRHAERIEELKVDKDYKQSLTKIASEIPERIGHGIASQVGEGGGSGNDSKLEFITCSEEGCGTRIYITPETKGGITCPKCGSIYTPEES